MEIACRRHERGAHASVDPSGTASALPQTALHAQGAAIARVLAAACCALLLAGATRAPSAGEDAAARWIAANCTLAGGALSVRPHGRFVSGYFGNITATGLAASGLRTRVVRDWMQWYVENAHDSASGVDGVPDDRTLRADGSVQLRGRPDSTDAYGATFLMLARAAFASGDPQAQAFLRAHHADIVRIARSVVATQQRSGLTFARPQHRIAYAIDNAQVFRGLLDGAALMEEAYGDAESARWMRARAKAVAAGIDRILWDPVTQTYRPQAGQTGTGAPANLAIAYPDALAQAYAVYYGIVDPRSARAASLLARSAPALASGEPEHRLVLALAQAASGDAPRDAAFEPLLCADAGWYLLLHAPQPEPGT